MNELKQAKTISRKSYDMVADMVYQELKRRQELDDRKQLEKTWKEIDRQVAMEPAHKKREDWHPEFEIPFQANTLEILVADIDNLRFPGEGDWFTTECEINNQFLERFQKDVRFLGGDNAELDQFNATQNDVNAVTQGILMHAHKQYRFQQMFNQLDAEAIKYGTMCARVTAVKSHNFQNQFGGVTREDNVLPVITPICIKNFYPDDVSPKALAQGVHVTPMQMTCYQQRAADLKMAAMRGNADIKEINGGWLKTHIKDIRPDKMGDLINLVDAEGDFIFENAEGDDLFVPNLCITMAYGKGVEKPLLVRIRENPLPFQSVFFDTYFKDGIGVYGVSPLMKGESLQKAAQQAMESVVKVSALQAEPPLSVNMQDPMIVAHGIKVEPGALWGSITPPEVNVIGDLQGAAGVLRELTLQYEDTTGVNRLRAGGQTKSHQTAHAVDSETEKGQSRTVKFVRNTESGMLTNLLQAELTILRKHMKEQSVYIPEYRGYITVSKASVPENVTFVVKGSSTPAEDRQRKVAELQALEKFMSLAPALQQLGAQPMNWDKISERMMENVFPNADVKDFFELSDQQKQAIAASQAQAQAEAAQGGAPAQPAQQGGI